MLTTYTNCFFTTKYTSFETRANLYLTTDHQLANLTLRAQMYQYDNGLELPRDFVPITDDGYCLNVMD